MGSGWKEYVGICFYLIHTSVGAEQIAERRQVPPTIIIIIIDEVEAEDRIVG